MSNRCTDTAKARVIRKFPKACSKQGLLSGQWYVYRNSIKDRCLGMGDTARQAWREAAKRHA